uniref:Anaphase-promoting complex subunit 2 n=1 Tax=Tanacetum cinerariifolium TaxID=118510 RepID=A0A6L2KBV5_TANCI|nr:anaphase-promoting complex subunit 2 [Tanacetum cinerariifolium]
MYPSSNSSTSRDPNNINGNNTNDNNNNGNQQGIGLARYRSAPVSFLTTTVDSVINGQSQQQSTVGNHMSGGGGTSTRFFSPPDKTSSQLSSSVSNTGGDRTSFRLNEFATAFNGMKSTTSQTQNPSPLFRHGSSPAGFLNTLVSSTPTGVLPSHIFITNGTTCRVEDLVPFEWLWFERAEEIINRHKLDIREQSSCSSWCSVAERRGLIQSQVKERPIGKGRLCMSCGLLADRFNRCEPLGTEAVDNGLLAAGLVSSFAWSFRIFKDDPDGVLEKHGAPNFWKNFDAYSNVPDLEMDDNDVQEDEVELLCKALEEISREKQYQEKCLSMLVNSLQLCQDNNISMEGNLLDVEKVLFSKYRSIVSSVLMTTLPHQFTEVLHRYYKGRLEELSTIIAGDDEDTYKTLENIGMVVHNLKSLGFTSMTEDAYASAIFLLLKAKVYDLVGDEYHNSVLESIKNWIQAVPL